MHWKQPMRPSKRLLPQRNYRRDARQPSSSTVQVAFQAWAATGSEAVKEARRQGRDTMDAGMGGDMIKVPYIPQMKIRGFGDARAFPGQPESCGPQQ